MKVRPGKRALVVGLAGLTMVVVVLALVSGLGKGDDPTPLGRVLGAEHSGPQPAAAPAAPAPLTTAAAVRPRVEHDLATVLVAKLGPGYELADPGRFPQGPLDATTAAELEPDPVAERRRLDARGFQRGYQRTWTTATGDVVGAVVYQFGDEAGAEGYLSDGAGVVLSQGAEEFPVAIDGARGFSQSDGSTKVHTVVFTRGPYFCLLFAGSERADSGAEPAVTAAVAQLTQLAGHG